MKLYWRLFVGVLGLALLQARNAADDGVVEEDFDEATPETPKEKYQPPSFQTPTISKKDAYFVDWFEDLKGIGKHWIKSIAKKDDVEESLAKYNGEWAVGAPLEVAIENDFGLIVKTKARHHAIAAKLKKPFEFNGQPLVVQYEVKYQDGQECGGGYVKLLSADSSLNVNLFNDKTPYSIMFGPDKCGATSKVHFIIRLKNPKNGTYSEHHARQPAKSLSSYFEDKATHLYTLVITPDNSFNILVDHVSIISGNLLTDLEPSVVPPKEIADPTDEKPSDWDDREYISDASAQKPEDWDEEAPREIVDEDATMPADWLESEEPIIADATAKKPDDWDDEVDGEWEPKQIDNPACQGRSGCGKWSKPLKPNPDYKGKWTAPKIANPAYKGKWNARLIDNPHYFDAEPYKQLASIGAIGFELWTMSANIVFDNVLITDSADIAREFARQTFDVKTAQESQLKTINNPTRGLVEQVLEATEEKPWLWAVFVLVPLIPIILISMYCFGKKSPSVASRPTKRSSVSEEVQAEDDVQNDVDGEEEVEIEEDSAPEDGCTSVKSTGKNDDETNKQDDASAETPAAAPASPAGPTRRQRVRRD